MNYFPSLIIRPKWHTAKRNVQVDDIVLVQDSNAIRGQWFLGKVTKVYPSNDGYVRSCELLYNLPSVNQMGHGDKRKIQRPVHKLIVLVPAEDV